MKILPEFAVICGDTFGIPSIKRTLLHNLSESAENCLRKYRGSICRHVTNFDVRFGNQAEHDVRRAEVKMKYRDGSAASITIKIFRHHLLYRRRAQEQGKYTRNTGCCFRKKHRHHFQMSRFRFPNRAVSENKAPNSLVNKTKVSLKKRFRKSGLFITKIRWQTLQKQSRRQSYRYRVRSFLTSLCISLNTLCLR